MLKVAALPADVLMLLSTRNNGFVPAFAALRAPRHPLRRFLKRALRCAIVARGRYYVAIRRDEEDLPAHSTARFPSRLRQRLDGHLGTGEADIPAVRLPRNGDGLGRALHRTTPPHGKVSACGEDERTILELGAVGILLRGESLVAVPPMQAGETGWLAVRHAPEDGLRGRVQPRQHVVQDLTVEGGVLRQVRAQGFACRFLLRAREGHAALLPQGAALLQGGVVARAARATAPQDARQLTRWRWRWRVRRPPLPLRGCAHAFHARVPVSRRGCPLVSTPPEGGAPTGWHHYPG